MLTSTIEDRELFEAKAKHSLSYMFIYSRNESWQSELLTELPPEPSTARFNDGKCDAKGRAWTVARWVGKFQRGHVSTSDEQRSRRPVSAGINLARAVIEQLMDEDRRWTLLQIGQVASRNTPSTGYCVMSYTYAKSQRGGYRMPLTEVQRWFRYAICSDHFERWLQDGDQFLSRIIAIDEFWAMAYEPELKSQSVEWRHAELPRRQKVLVVRDIIVCHFVPHGRAVTAQYYRDFLVQHGVRDKCPGPCGQCNNPARQCKTA
ncbi:histone-lysine N-methyltransferase SETMAR [Trichonephila clavata]|uniref:Histone-lysine N-methyltransferase SETMAR n=1 Tax=Trichonephila clavata TaxID=2740835 RepID=A0A8X6H0J1_TRICU|nr:histone-lysine N-methyltransferase SETMAR [Trichonephila clavata]